MVFLKNHEMSIFQVIDDQTTEGDEHHRWLNEQRKSPYSESSPGLFELEAVEHDESSTVECRESGKMDI